MNLHISIIMPAYNQAAFIRRAVLSLYAQTHPEWELIIVNDGSTDDTEAFIRDFLSDDRVTYIKNEENQGLGRALNQGLDAARYDLVAYLPADDCYFENHLETLCRMFEKRENLTLAYSGMRIDTSDTLHRAASTSVRGVRKGYCLQLVQVAHRRTAHRWVERSEWVSEDLFAMFWSKLAERGVFGATGIVSCQWTSHPFQRHKLIGERYGGGLNKYRRFYHVKSPVRMRVSKYKFVDEERLYAGFRAAPSAKAPSLKILLLGELAYNPERVYALEQAGHRLYGFWVSNPSFCFSTVGPLPFGHVEDIPAERWRERIPEVAPDVIYGLLNFGAVPLAYEVMRAFPRIPFVWHFKEGPSVCLRNGTWDKLIYLYAHAAGRIFLNDTVRRWFGQFLPPGEVPTMLLDGDLPKRDCFKQCFSPKLSAADGAVHTVVAGRMIGISGNDLAALARNDVHVHLYTENYHDSRSRENAARLRAAPRHFHLHAHVDADRWTEELSRYDAGWLHSLRSGNNGRLGDASWDDLNIPARISTYAAAGLPVILRNNAGHEVATQSLAKGLGIGVFFDDIPGLCARLKDGAEMQRLAENMLRHRLVFSFDCHVPRLTRLFEEAIREHKKRLL